MRLMGVSVAVESLGDPNGLKHAVATWRPISNPSQVRVSRQQEYRLLFIFAFLNILNSLCLRALTGACALLPNKAHR